MSLHVLPVKWDGWPILWDHWMPMDGLLICGKRLGGPYRCPGCGTKAMPRSITGKAIRILPDGRPSLISLVLYRCMTCGYTTVSSLDAHSPARWQHWVLDEDDYSDAGSYDTKETRR